MGLGKTYSTKYLLDSNNNRGAVGQVLSTTSTGIDWVNANTVPGAGLWIESGNDIYNSNSGNVGIGTTAPTAPLHFGKSVYGAPSSENFFRVKFFDNGGIMNDVGIGQPNSSSIGWNITPSVNGVFEWNSGTRGRIMNLDYLGKLTLDDYDGTNQTGTPTFLLGTDASGNVVKTNTIPGSGAGPYLPLAGGTMTGTIVGRTAGNSSANPPTLQVVSSGTSNAQAAIAIQQKTTEGDTIIFADYDPFVEYGISTENGTDSIHFTGGTSTGSLGSRTFYNNAGNARTAYTKFKVELGSGKVFMGGDVGIGTTNTGAKLDVAGTLRTSDDITINNSSPELYMLTGASHFNWMLAAQENVSNAFEITPSTTVNGTTFSTPALVVLQNGNVGIGTNSASVYRLNVTKSDGNVAFFTDSATADLAIKCSSAVTTLVPTTATLAFGTSNSEKIRINNLGNLLIGQTANYTPTGASATARTVIALSQNEKTSLVVSNQNNGLNAYAQLVLATYGHDFSIRMASLAAGSALQFIYGNSERMSINSSGGVKLAAYSGTAKTGTPTYILGTDSSGTIVKVLGGNIPGLDDGPYLPLSAGSGFPLTGNLTGTTISLTGGITADTFRNNAGNTNYNFFTRDSTGNTIFVQAAQENASQQIARFSYGSATVNSGNTVLQVSRDNSHFVNCNVGIGTTSPAAKLNVVGATGLPATSGTAFTGTMRLGVSGYGTVMDFGAVGPSTGTQWIQVTDASNQALHYPLLLQPNGGNVGIGLTVPAGKLSVQGTGGGGVPTFDVINTSATTFNHSAEFMTPNMTDEQNNIVVIGRASSTKNAGYIGWKYKGGAGSNENILTFGHWGSDNLMNLDGLGNLGIGTEIPGAKLDVVGPSNGSSILKLQRNGVGSGYAFGISDIGTGSLQLFTTALGDDSGFVWRTRQSGGSVVEALFIAPDGKVGIGTVTPAQKLHVAGTVRWEGVGTVGLLSGGETYVNVSQGGDYDLRLGRNDDIVIEGNGKVGIGTNASNAQLQIKTPGTNHATLEINTGNSGYGVNILSFDRDNTAYKEINTRGSLFTFNPNDAGVMLSANNVGVLIGTTTSITGVKLNVDGTVLIKDSSGVADFYLGNYGGSANHFRFHTNNIDTYFDMNCGNLFWRDGGSTRYTFFPATANMTVNGTITQNSDVRVKENIVEIGDCISKVQAMRGVYYNRTDFNTEATKVGVIAQEVEAVLPELIVESPEDGLKSVAYSELTAVLINAIKEQQEIIEDLKTRVKQLENK